MKAVKMLPTSEDVYVINKLFNFNNVDHVMRVNLAGDDLRRTTIAIDFIDHNDVISKVIETDDDFKPLPNGYDYLVDFLALSFPSKRPDREHPYEEIKSRIGVMRHVVKNGLLWDNLYIGFQNRLSREPDVYHHRFWNHFQTELPITPPDWDLFLEQEPAADGSSCVLS